MVAAVMWQVVPLGRVPPVCVVVGILAIGDVCVLLPLMLAVPMFGCVGVGSSDVGGGAVIGRGGISPGLAGHGVVGSGPVLASHGVVGDGPGLADHHVVIDIARGVAGCASVPFRHTVARVVVVDLASHAVVVNSRGLVGRVVTVVVRGVVGDCVGPVVGCCAVSDIVAVVGRSRVA